MDQATDQVGELLMDTLPLGRLAEHAPALVKAPNLGDACGITNFTGEARLNLPAICDNMAGITTFASHRPPEIELNIELARRLWGVAGVNRCRVVERQSSGGQVFLVADGGLLHHLSNSDNFGQTLRKNHPLAIGNSMDATADAPATVPGPLCTPPDLPAERMALPDTQPGALVVVFQSGAHGATASPQGYLGHTSVVEVLM